MMKRVYDTKILFSFAICVEVYKILTKLFR